MLEWLQNAAAVSCHEPLDALGMWIFEDRCCATSFYFRAFVLKGHQDLQTVSQMMFKRWIGAYIQQPSAINLVVTANPSSWTATVPPGRAGTKSSCNNPVPPCSSQFLLSTGCFHSFFEPFNDLIVLTSQFFERSPSRFCCRIHAVVSILNDYYMICMRWCQYEPAGALRAFGWPPRSHISMFQATKSNRE